MSDTVRRFDVEGPVTDLTVTVSDGAVTRIEFGTHAGRTAGDSLELQVAKELAEYQRGERTEFTFPLRLEGTEFERRVWECLLRIPYGETMTYGELARAVGKPGAARAVGAANGKNPVAIVVPCHRVVAAGGKLGGYGGGLPLKRRLLDLETAHSPAIR